MATIENLSTATPAEIDAALYAALVKVSKLSADRSRYLKLIQRIDEVKPGSYQSYLEGNSPEARAEMVLTAGECEVQMAKIQENEVSPLENEFILRGGWTRYYLVDNANGHVHRDEYCTTCFSTTQYAWLTEQSGMTAEDLVELAGKQACTVCFPWAPVEILNRKSSLETPEKKAARLEREAKKAEREAKAAIKAIVNVDGTALRENAGNKGSILKTVVSARNRLTDYTEYQDVLQWGNYSASIDHLAEAIAAKEGKTVETVKAEALTRAKKRK